MKKINIVGGLSSIILVAILFLTFQNCAPGLRVLNNPQSGSESQSSTSTDIAGVPNTGSSVADGGNSNPVPPIIKTPPVEPLPPTSVPSTPVPELKNGPPSFVTYLIDLPPFENALVSEAKLPLISSVNGIVTYSDGVNTINYNGGDGSFLSKSGPNISNVWSSGLAISRSGYKPNFVQNIYYVGGEPPAEAICSLSGTYVSASNAHVSFTDGLLRFPRKTGYFYFAAGAYVFGFYNDYENFYFYGGSPIDLFILYNNPGQFMGIANGNSNQTIETRIKAYFVSHPEDAPGALKNNTAGISGVQYFSSINFDCAAISIPLARKPSSQPVVGTTKDVNF